MACTNCGSSGPFASVEDFEGTYFYDPGVAAEVELLPLLKHSAGRIRMALKASGQDQCTYDTAACDYLKELNMMAAAVMSNALCFRLSDEQRRIMNDNLNAELVAIRNGEIELCQGETAKNYPAFGVAQYGTTTRQRANLILNDEQRTS